MMARAHPCTSSAWCTCARLLFWCMSLVFSGRKIIDGRGCLTFPLSTRARPARGVPASVYHIQWTDIVDGRVHLPFGQQIVHLKREHVISVGGGLTFDCV